MFQDNCNTCKKFFDMLLRSDKAVSGYKYIICDKQAKPCNRWKVQYKKKRSNGFETPKEAAHFLLKLYPFLSNESSNEEENDISNDDHRDDGRWWMKDNVRLCTSELTRMSLFGIRLIMYDKEENKWPKTKLERICYLESLNITVPKDSQARQVASLLRKHLQKQATSTEYSLKKLWNMLYPSFVYKESYGTVIGYFPATQRHVILFDDDDKFLTNKSDDVVAPKTYTVNLLASQNWRRIPWEGNVLDNLEECGERVKDANDLVNAFGPNCPRCYNNLGVGALAWSSCAICKLNEPGVMWSLRLNETRNNQFAISPKCYTET